MAVSGGGRRETGFRWAYKAGVVAEAASDAEPDLSMTMASQDAIDVLSGRIEPSVAFMRGRLKTSGDNGMLLLFLESTTSEEFGRWRDAVAALAPETSAAVS
jgi:putative sterol carrier protein